MTSSATAQELVDKLTAEGVAAVCDPRAATPPCVLLSPPSLTFDVGCGATADWSVWLLAPGPANLDAWAALDELLRVVDGVVPIGRVDFLNYSVSPESPLLPAYRVQFTGGIDL